jgi:hypothetical protein
VAQAAMNSNEMMAASSGIVARTSRVVMAPGTYPRMWAKKS